MANSYFVEVHQTVVKIYEINAENEREAEELIKKYPHIEHRIMIDSTTHKATKKPDSVQELLDRIFKDDDE